ncbi:MAG: TIGR01244 family protein [Candidatus Tokpelaia hoelldobleri]|uniref:TIGR01244 family protein n=1 Tax=Candidatus Tokpelaia hoelldobleri TaxID=1902579 RepID=A0A1U9JTI9_9HYPH|nr:MAG: TIGR01244 family protein [Candidatus Tokpelaia hoelldoblerii]
MNLRQIDDSVYISGQMTAEDLADLHRLGIRTIICNRPDGEVADQPGFAALQQAAQQYGIIMHYIPVVPPHATPEQVQAMAQALQRAERPVVAYCKSGGRAQMLYKLATGQ